MDFLGDWARALVERRTHRSPTLARLRGSSTCGERLTRQAEAHDPAWLAGRLGLEPLESLPLLPPEADLDACRKPFQLWNVQRELREDPFGLEVQEELRLGPIATEVVPARPTITPSATEVYLLGMFRASRWFDQSLQDLRAHRRLRLLHGRPPSAPPPTFVSQAERDAQAPRDEDG